MMDPFEFGEWLGEWIKQHFGRLGLLAAFLIIVAVLALAFVLLNRLPERKEDTSEDEEKNN